MSYEVALNLAWEALISLSKAKNLSVKFLGDQYDVNTTSRAIQSVSCNIPAKDFLSVLLLHYLANNLKGLPQLTNQWISFKEMPGGDPYYPAFRKRAIEPILRKYGKNPEGLSTNLQRLSARIIDKGDVGILVEAFEKVPVLIEIWRGDAEFGPEVNMLFDKSIVKIFNTEDTAVLAGFVAASV